MKKRISVEVPDRDYWQRQIKCQSACPVNTDARGYVRAIAAGDYEQAYMIARAPNPLASICGRVCGAPCQMACRRGAIDEPVSIRALKRFVTERFGSEAKRVSPLSLLQGVFDARPASGGRGLEELGALVRSSNLAAHAGSTGQKIAIVGSGPAGLAAAHDLALMGFRPTIYEMEPVPAGMLAVGIPEYRLPRELILAEIEVIKALGVEIICNTQVGQDISLHDIREQHAATLIAVGAKHSRAIPIPGHDAQGVMGGVEFLREASLKHPLSLGRRVVVIGGGNVAYDVSRTVIRQAGVDVSRVALRQPTVCEVHMCCLESLDEMPAEDTEIIEGDEEGIFRHNSFGPKEILVDDAGRVTGVSFKRVLHVFDENGRFSPEFDEDDVTTIEADTVLWAIGQKTDLSFLGPEEEDVHTTERGLVECDPETLRTTAEDVFVAGDVAHGTRFLIDAVASGKKVARSIYRFLTDKKLDKQVTGLHVLQPVPLREMDYEKIPRNPIPTLEVSERTLGMGIQVERGYDEKSAVSEACRCLDCGVNTIFDGDKCILCGGCVDVCPELCLQIVSVDRLQGGEELSSLLAARYGEEPLSGQSAIIKDEERCIRCALCAVRCPVGAITMERFEFDGKWVE